MTQIKDRLQFKIQLVETIEKNDLSVEEKVNCLRDLIQEINQESGKVK